MRKWKSYFREIGIIKYLAEGIAVTALLAWIFYGTVLAAAFLFPVAVVFAAGRVRAVKSVRKQRLAMQFKDAIIAMSAALSSGYSLENSVVESEREMSLLYGRDSDICRELGRINSGVELNIPIEKLFMELAERTDIDDVNTFTHIIVAAKTTGGSMIDIIRNTADILSCKAETMREIEVLVSAKKMEQKIMNIVPLLMIAYVGVTSSDFFDIMYKTWQGRIIMTVCLLAYIVAYFLSERIVDIEI